MLLFDIFYLIYPRQQQNTPLSETELEQLSSPMLTQADLMLAKKRTHAAYREAPSLREAYDAFLLHCLDILGKHSQTPMLPLIIDYLAELNASPEQTQAQIETIHALFTFNLREQTHAQGVMALGRCFVDSPKAFAGFLQWLMQHGVSTEEVLQAHLLQDYLRYHMRSLNNADNPVAQLYTLLTHHTHTQQLAEQAKQVRCPEAGLASYALDGSIHNPTVKALDNPVRTQPDIDIQLTPNNLKALYRVFGVPFLVSTLRWHVDNNDEHTSSMLLTLFNGPHITYQDFTLLLQHLRTHHHLKSALSMLLHDNTLDKFMDARIGGLASLMIYSEYLATKISRQDLAVYLCDIKQTCASPLDLVSDLSAIMIKFEKRNKPHALLAFEHLFEIMLEHPDVLDDEKLLRQLRKFKPAKAQFITHIAWLEATFDASISTYTNTSMEAFDYISIEDMWREIHLKIDTIQTIENIPNTFPSDKYKLQCRILKALKTQLSDAFVLNDFIQKLGITPHFCDDEVTPYERLLIEILVSIDDENFRVDIIQRLSTNTSTIRSWYNLNFDDNSLHMHAARHGNLGFILWLESNNIKPNESHEKLTHAAANAKHWLLVQHFHQKYKLDHPCVNKLLQLAVEQNASKAILPLWQGKKYAPRLAIVEKLFKFSIEEGHVNCVKTLLACPIPPCDTKITQGYRTALKTHQIRIINLILETAKSRHLPCLNKAIDQTAAPKNLPKVSDAKHQQNALAQHGLFRQNAHMSHSHNDLALPPLLLRQTSL